MILEFHQKIVGVFWYWLSVDRYNTCWEKACKSAEDCITDFLYCGSGNLRDYDNWKSVSDSVLDKKCAVDGDKPPFDFGIFKQALSSGIVYSRKFIFKYCYGLWWGLQNLRKPLDRSKQETMFRAIDKHFGLHNAILLNPS